MSQRADDNKTIDRNIKTIHRLRKDSDDRRRLDQKIIDYIVRLAGTSPFLYVQILIYGFLFFLNVKLEVISVAASLEAIFLTTFVLINQRHTSALERKNSDLHLQMSLLAEHELTRIARATEAIGRHVGVEGASLKELAEIKKEVRADEVLERISRLEENIPTSSTLNAPLKK